MSTPYFWADNYKNDMQDADGVSIAYFTDDYSVEEGTLFGNESLFRFEFIGYPQLNCPKKYRCYITATSFVAAMASFFDFHPTIPRCQIDRIGGVSPYEVEVYMKWKENEGDEGELNTAVLRDSEDASIRFVFETIQKGLIDNPSGAEGAKAIITDPDGNAKTYTLTIS